MCVLAREKSVLQMVSVSTCWPAFVMFICQSQKSTANRHTPHIHWRARHSHSINEISNSPNKRKRLTAINCDRQTERQGARRNVSKFEGKKKRKTTQKEPKKWMKNKKHTQQHWGKVTRSSSPCQNVFDIFIRFFFASLDRQRNSRTAFCLLLL